MTPLAERDRTVLLVEDDEATAELERRALARSGLKSRVVARVADALGCLERESFVAILLDYQLPDGDPWAVVEAAKARVPRIPVVIVTATGNERVAAEAIHRGVVEYVKKADTFWDQLPGIVDRVSRLAQAEEQLRRTDAIFQLITAHGSDMIVVTDAGGTIKSISPASRAILGYDPEEMVGRSGREFVDPESLPEMVLSRVATGPEKNMGSLVRARRKDGHRVWLESNTCVLRDVDGRATEIISVTRDVTGHILGEERLKAKEARLAEAQRIAHLGSWEWDIPTNKVTWSDELYRIFGLDKATFGASYEAFLESVHPDDRRRVDEVVQSAHRSREPFSTEYQIVRPSGEIRFVVGRGRVIVDEANRPIRMAGTAQDTTERKELETKLVFSDRMASVGTLAGGVAHEINNPLTYVMANLDVIAQELRENESGSTPAQTRELMELVNEARGGAERVRKIVRGLKTFARTEEERREPLEVQRVLEVAINMSFTEIRHRARLVKDYAPVPLVYADEPRLAQVFINILVNAAQAIPEGKADRNEIRVSTRTDQAGRAVVEVRDTGAGIPKHLQARVFDPFFTTKSIGTGTGLGLSICHGIVVSLGGEIGFESEPGRGATFRVVLPPAPADSQPQETARAAARPAAGRRGRVLVVDDEPMVVRSLGRILAGEHDVKTAGNGREALEILSREAFDVILCDLMMSELTGMDVYAELLERAPEVAERMVFLTGGAFTPTGKDFLDRVPNQRLEKPFDVMNIRAVIRSLVR